MQLGHGKERERQAQSHKPLRERDRLQVEHISQSRQVHGGDVQGLRSERAEQEQAIAQRAEREEGRGLRATIAGLDVFKQHQEQQYAVLRLRNGPAVIQHPAVRGEGDQRHQQCRDSGALDHDAVKDGLLGGARRALQLAAFARLERQRNVLNAVGDQVQPQELNRPQRGWQPEGCGQHEQQDLGQPAGDEKVDDLSHVGVGDAAFLDPGDDRSEVVIGQDQIGALACDIGAALAHGHADVGGTQCGRVVGAIASDRDKVSQASQGLNDLELLVWLDTREDASLLHQRIDGFAALLCDASKHGPSHDLISSVGEAQLLRDG